MDWEFEDEVTRRLRRYAAAVGEVLGLSGESSCVDAERPCSLYLAIDGRLREFPDEDLALVWNDRDGWRAVVESPGGGPLREVSRFTGPVHATPRAVAAWVEALLARGELSLSA
ncbi:DUF6292 family protein [Umezawaea sp. Da 62-37]|uniref:DUF6292 family protein n=1 Tax=Umezawaea sp. Da 62-37 TaxID=3075927 RepID=UPI0028F7201D|nr:DUF6292 family protein [Umezawaea sp. Da 62-37]WNV87425.1 DUF6292 family protein [Umezawaea sp. Da 62-37]